MDSLVTTVLIIAVPLIVIIVLMAIIRIIKLKKQVKHFTILIISMLKEFGLEMTPEQEQGLEEIKAHLERLENELAGYV